MSKRILIATLLGTALTAPAAFAQSTTTTPDQKPSINQRLENQKDRIQAGKQDDQLTKGEKSHLVANDAAIHAQEKVYRKANDGKLTTGERKQLNHELNKNSRDIYRARHNNRNPKS